MSKLFKSRDVQDTRVTGVDLRSRPVAAPQTNRPLGGFVGMRVEHPEAPLSQVERLEREATARVEQARREAEQIQRDAYLAGFEQGEKAGQKLALQKAEPTIQTFTTLIEQMQQERATLIEQHERELIKVAYLIAQRVLHGELERHPERVREVVAAAVAKVDTTQPLTIVLAPMDKQLIEAEIAGGLLKGRFSLQPTLLADEAMPRGGCRVLTEAGDIDAAIDSQLIAIRDGLWDTQDSGDAAEASDVEA